MKIDIAQSLCLLAALACVVEGAPAKARQRVLKKGSAVFNSKEGQVTTINLTGGDLPAGTYEYLLTIRTGSISEMTVLDGTKNVYADTAPGWGWSSEYNPNEIFFDLDKATKGITFTAKTESKKVSLRYEVLAAKN